MPNQRLNEGFESDETTESGGRTIKEVSQEIRAAHLKAASLEEAKARSAEVIVTASKMSRLMKWTNIGFGEWIAEGFIPGKEISAHVYGSLRRGVSTYDLVIKLNGKKIFSQRYLSDKKEPAAELWNRIEKRVNQEAQKHGVRMSRLAEGKQDQGPKVPAPKRKSEGELKQSPSKYLKDINEKVLEEMGYQDDQGTDASTPKTMTDVSKAIKGA